jgi:ribosomal protein S18 acetylase RimI-like enzyme
VAANEASEVSLRLGTEDDARGMAKVHFDAVCMTASSFYPAEVIASWTREPDEGRSEQFRHAVAKGEELFVVACQGVDVVGFGSLVPALTEVRAVYVAPRFGRRGIGGRILEELERMAIERAIPALQLEASVNAELFYSRAGYEVVARGTHQLGSGACMASIRMRKSLVSAAPS